MTWLIVEEAGDVGFSTAASHYFLVIVIVTSDIMPLRRAVAKTRKQFQRKLKNMPEFKAFKTDRRILRRLLKNALASEWSLIGLIADKRSMKQMEDPEALYRQMAAKAIEHAARIRGTFSVIADKRYTNWRQWQRFTDTLSAIAEISEGVTLTIRQEPSEKERAIQVADAIAHALFQKYERADEELYQLIRGRIRSEEMWKK